jgi:hypothetical protein
MTQRERLKAIRTLLTIHDAADDEDSRNALVQAMTALGRWLTMRMHLRCDRCPCVNLAPFGGQLGSRCGDESGRRTEPCDGLLRSGW